MMKSVIAAAYVYILWPEGPEAAVTVEDKFDGKFILLATFSSLYSGIRVELGTTPSIDFWENK